MTYFVIIFFCSSANIDHEVKHSSLIVCFDKLLFSSNNRVDFKTDAEIRNKTEQKNPK